MKRTIKTSEASIIIVLLVILICSCGRRVEGTWEGYYEVGFMQREYLQLMIMGSTFEMIIGGQTEGKGTYTYSGNTITLKYDDGRTRTGTVAGNGMILDLRSGRTSLTRK